MADEFAGSPDAHAEGGDGLLQADPEIAVGDGFEAFVRAQQPSLAAYLARRMPEADVPDVMQDAMIRLLRYRGLPEMQLRPLLYRIAQNVMHDRGRRDLSHRRQDHVALDEYGTGLASPGPTQEELLAHRQQLDRVREAIRALPPRCREVYLLNRQAGMSYPQIARHCGISVKAVEKHISRALQALRQCLAGTGAGGAP